MRTQKQHGCLNLTQIGKQDHPQADGRRELGQEEMRKGMGQEESGIGKMGETGRESMAAKEPSLGYSRDLIHGRLHGVCEGDSQ